MDQAKLTALQAAGKKAAEIHQKVAIMIKPGLDMYLIEEYICQEIAQAGMEPAFLGYNGYPFASCLSVNDEIVHGLPHHYHLEEGDVLKVDLGVKNNGWMVDTARTHPVGTVSPEAQNLIAVTSLALDKALSVCRAGNFTGDIGAIVEKTVKDGGIAVVKDLSGHGVGRALQEEPSIPNYGHPGKGVRLKEGMVLAIEPITSIKPTKIAVLADGWTIIAQNQSLTAQFEHTVIVTQAEPIVLTN